MHFTTSRSISNILRRIERVAELRNLENEAENYIPSINRELIYYKMQGKLKFYRRLHHKSEYSERVTGLCMDIELKELDDGTFVNIRVNRAKHEKIFFYAWFLFFGLLGIPLSIISFYESAGFVASLSGVLLTLLFLLIGYLAYIFSLRRYKRDTQFMENAIYPCLGVAIGA